MHFDDWNTVTAVQFTISGSAVETFTDSPIETYTIKIC